MASDEVAVGDGVAVTNRFVAEAQVGFGDPAGLLGVVFEVRLYIHIRVVANDLNGVFVGTDGTVAAETPELAVDDLGIADNEAVIHR